MIDSGAKLETIADNEDTPLIIAAEQGDRSHGSIADGKRSHLSARDRSLETSLAKAARQGNERLVKMLLGRTSALAEKNGAVFAAVSGVVVWWKFQMTVDPEASVRALHSPAHKSLELLLNDGADANARNEDKGHAAGQQRKGQQEDERRHNGADAGSQRMWFGRDCPECPRKQ